MTVKLFSISSFHFQQTEWPMREAMPVKAKAGDVLVFSYLLVHGIIPDLTLHGPTSWIKESNTYPQLVVPQAWLFPPMSRKLPKHVWQNEKDVFDPGWCRTNWCFQNQLRWITIIGDRQVASGEDRPQNAAHRSPGAGLVTYNYDYDQSVTFWFRNFSVPKLFHFFMVLVSVSKIFGIKEVLVFVSQKKIYQKKYRFRLVLVSKKYRYQFRKVLLSQKVSISVSKSIGIAIAVFCFWPLSIYFGHQVLNMAGKLWVSALYPVHKFWSKKLQIRFLKPFHVFWWYRFQNSLVSENYRYRFRKNLVPKKIIGIGKKLV